MAYATAVTPIPAGVDVDPHLGAHVESGPCVAAMDGGVIEARDGGEILDESESADERPEDCECWGHPDETLPCWYCYAHGFDEPNPDAGEEDES